MKWILYKLTFHFFLRLPDAILSFLFTIFHPIYKATHKKRAYGRVEKHLKNCGFATDSAKNVSAKEVFKSLYWNGIDSYRLLARMPSAIKRVRYENEDVIREALAQGPIVALSIHQGAFENLHRSLCRYSQHVHLITNPFKNKALTRTLQNFRQDSNLHEYSTDEVSTVLRSLFKTKGILAMVVDQAKDARGNTVKLFGRESTLYLRLPVKANQMGAGIVTFRTFCEMATDEMGKKIRQHVVRFENYYPPKTAASEAGEMDFVQGIAREIEGWIKEHPEQWCWNYHRNFCIEN